MEEENKTQGEAITSEASQEKKDSSSVNMIAILSYLGILLIIPLMTSRNDDFVKYHVKQGIVLLVTAVAISLIAWFPIIGWIAGFFAWIGCVILAIIGIINVVQGKKNNFPLLDSLLISLKYKKF